MVVYDVNSDCLNDVMATLETLGVYKSGAITFVQHMVTDNQATKKYG